MPVTVFCGRPSSVSHVRNTYSLESGGRLGDAAIERKLVDQRQKRNFQHTGERDIALHTLAALRSQKASNHERNIQPGRLVFRLCLGFCTV